eukprot:15473102-Alexandrium_andersonii.AAC.1
MTGEAAHFERCYSSCNVTFGRSTARALLGRLCSRGGRMWAAATVAAEARMRWHCLPTAFSRAEVSEGALEPQFEQD